ncbi:MAG TPA: prolipoprotein diacylglyceryl transferase family protein, partial [Candidatus Binatus sp.]|nr:prolipoprotein diacylglyceryl transferase family protein [Candidatus Binatus sp.]
VLTLAFDPVIHIAGGLSVRIETVLLAVVLLASIALAARNRTGSPAAGPKASVLAQGVGQLLAIIAGAGPGAIFGGRLGDVLDHLDFYRANPGLIVDPGHGGFGLTLAVPLAIVTGGITGGLIGAPVARWMHSLAVPMLVALAASKVAALAGAAGQGLPNDLPWATAYVGPGPWDSLAAAVPSQPSAAYEAILVAAAIVGLTLLRRREVVARGDGVAMLVALGLWATARFVVAFTWRDPAVLGPLRIDQLLSLLLIALAALGGAERVQAHGGPARPGDGGSGPRPDRRPEPSPDG